MSFAQLSPSLLFLYITGQFLLMTNSESYTCIGSCALMLTTASLKYGGAHKFHRLWPPACLNLSASLYLRMSEQIICCYVRRSVAACGHHSALKACRECTAFTPGSHTYWVHIVQSQGQSYCKTMKWVTVSILD